MIPEPISSDLWQSMEDQPFPTLSVISGRSELSGIGMTGRTGIGRTRVQQRAGELGSVIECRSADLIRASSPADCVNRPNRWQHPTLHVATFQKALARRGPSIDVERI